jgi:carboxyl-terminal processing protease
MVDREGHERTWEIPGDELILQVPLAVLIDERTASGGVLFPATVQARGAGRLFGARTGGLYTGSEMMALSDGSALQLSTLRMLTPEGEPLRNIIAAPDEAVALDPEALHAGQDAPLERAAAYLREDHPAAVSTTVE